MSDDEISEQLKAIWPEVIGAVITRHNGKVNLCPVNFQAVSTKYEQPLCVCLGLDNKNLTIQQVLASKEFVYAYPSKEQLKDILYCGTVSGRDVDKLAQTTLTLEPAETVAAPLLADAVLNLECKLVHSYDAGRFTIVIGQIERIVSSERSGLDKIYSVGMTYGVIEQMRILQEGR